MVSGTYGQCGRSGYSVVIGSIRLGSQATRGAGQPNARSCANSKPCHPLVRQVMTGPQVLMRAPAYQTEAKQRRSEKGQARRFRGQGRNQDASDFSAWITGSVDVEIIGSGFD